MAKLPKNNPQALIEALQADVNAADGADLSGLVFKGLTVKKELLFRSANLKRSNFSKSKLYGVGFADSDLTGSDFSGAVIEQSYSDSSKLIQANLEGATILQSLFSSADFSGARARGLTISDTGWPGKFVGADLREATFDDTSCMGTDATRADFTGASLSKGTYQEGNFRDAKLVDVDLSGALVEKCDLRGTDLTGANLNKARFAKCLWDEHTKWPGVPPKGVIWKGKGKPPSGASAAPQDPTPASLKAVGSLSSWGDPLLLVDAAEARAWTGGGDDGKTTEYRRACKVLGKGDAAAFAFGKARGALWSVEGEGTVFAYRVPNGLLIVRAWSEDDEDEDAGVLAALPQAKAKSAGTLTLASGCLALFGAAFDASGIPAKASKKGVSSCGDDDEALLVALPRGTYQLRCDRVKGPRGAARRILLTSKK